MTATTRRVAVRVVAASDFALAGTGKGTGADVDRRRACECGSDCQGSDA